MTKTPQTGTLNQLAKKYFASAISDFSRGSSELEEYAVRQCLPAVAAISLDESYATLVITSRMDLLLSRIITHGARRQGSADVLLFDSYKPLSSFGAKINMAYFLGFVSERMYCALECCRNIRNAYAHCDSPDKAREEKKYLKNKRQLLEIDREFNLDCIRKLRESISELPEIADEALQITALMVAICDSLDRIAVMNSLNSSSMTPPVIPAIFGFENPPLPGT